MQLPAKVFQLIQSFHDQGGKALIVGGAVRDFLLNGNLTKDLDLEVYGLNLDQVQAVLDQVGRVVEVGRSFGVFKINLGDWQLDVSLPRKERKIDRGHRGFDVLSDPFLSYPEAASRRDFTINAMAYDAIADEIIDPFQGRLDLQNRLLRHIGPAFVEDPLRVLRAIQFAARFNLQVLPETQHLCQQLDLHELPKERLFGEFKKLLLQAEKPAIGLKVAESLGVLKYFPEMAALQGVQQDPQWHPEGDVWVHTLMVLDEAAKLRCGDEFDDLCLMFGALCHDFGKPATTVWKDGRWRSPNHDIAGIALTISFMKRLTEQQLLIDRVCDYVREHLKPAMLYKVKDQVSDGAIRRLALRVPIPELLKVAQADHFGRTTVDAIAREFPAGAWLLSRAQNLAVHDRPPQAILQGRHLKNMGLPPGPIYATILSEAFEFQLDGKMSELEQFLTWAEERIKRLES